MYLSKVHVSWHKSHNPYELHRALWELFPDRPDDERQFLFRVEHQQRGLGTQLLLQSALRPQERTENCQVSALREYNPTFGVEQRLRFRLTANPIKTIRDERGRTNKKGEVKSCRVPLVDEEEQLQWLARKLNTAVGLEVAIVQSRNPLYFRKRGQAGKIMMVTFDGILQVQDPKLLLEIVSQGIGPAKSFGCGMLSLARA